MRNLRYLGLGLLALLCAFSVNGHAQISSKVFLEGGKIVPVVGPVIEKGNILIEDGRIVAVGANIKAPFDAKVLDVTGKTIFPGMVDAWTSKGLKVANENLDVVPYVDVYDVLDPSGRFFEEALRGGVTSIHVSQGKNCVISGLSRTVHPIGMTVDEMTQDPEGGLVLSMAPKRGYDHAVQRAILRDTFADLDRYLDRRAGELYLEKMKKDGEETNIAPSEARTKGKDLIKPDKLDKKYRNLYLLRQGKIDGYIVCDRAMDVSVAFDFAKKQGMENSMALIIGGECYKVAKKLKALKRPVILTPGNMIYREQDRMTLEDKDTFVPKALSDAKVDFAIGGSDAPWEDAARCVRNGVSREKAVAAITINAAKAIGLEHLIGSIEKGKLANLLVLSGDPLDNMTWVESVLVGGHLVYERSKDKRLRDLMDGMYETEKIEKKRTEEAAKSKDKAAKGKADKGAKSKKD
ncbi:MAG: imidazolonepropionase-like amidohydrolase [Planctomycetota bacterium]|jgi:imidazolonepropionase-like amidohydrolase